MRPGHLPDGNVKDPLLEGFLFKQGQNDFRKRWRKRWFILPRNSHTIYYFKRRDRYATLPSEPQGTIFLEEDTFVSPADELDPAVVAKLLPKFRETGFSVRKDDADREYFLYADTAKEQQTWVVCLNSVLGQSFAASSPASSLETPAETGGSGAFDSVDGSRTVSRSPEPLHSRDADVALSSRLDDKQSVELLKRELRKREESVRRTTGKIERRTKEIEDMKEQYFVSVAMFAKLNAAESRCYCNIDIYALYDKVVQLGIPFERWDAWIAKTVAQYSREERQEPVRTDYRMYG